MHPQTLKPESVDASTDSIYRVGRCIHRLYVQSRWMHPPTLELESVDASTDSVYRVGRCIHRPMKYGLSYRLSTDCNESANEISTHSIQLWSNFNWPAALVLSYIQVNLFWRREICSGLSHPTRIWTNITLENGAHIAIFLFIFWRMLRNIFLARMTKASPLSTACKYLKVKTSQSPNHYR